VKVRGPQGKAKGDLLFIHGWPDCGDLWKEQVQELSKEYTCIVVTMPGYDGN